MHKICTILFVYVYSTLKLNIKTAFDCSYHNPRVGGSNPSPATTFPSPFGAFFIAHKSYHKRHCYRLFAGCFRRCQARNPRISGDTISSKHPLYLSCSLRVVSGLRREARALLARAKFSKTFLFCDAFSLSFPLFLPMKYTRANAPAICAKR